MHTLYNIIGEGLSVAVRNIVKATDKQQLKEALVSVEKAMMRGFLDEACLTAAEVRSRMIDQLPDNCFYDAVQEYYTTFHHIAAYDLLDTDRIELFVYEGITVYEADFQVSITTMIPPGVPSAVACKALLDAGPSVMVNKAFLEMPEEFRQALLDHEIGHIVLGHLDLVEGHGRYENLELEADAYSASKGNKMFEALKLLSEQSPILQYQEEVAKRLAALA